MEQQLHVTYGIILLSSVWTYLVPTFTHERVAEQIPPPWHFYIISSRVDRVLKNVKAQNSLCQDYLHLTQMSLTRPLLLWIRKSTWECPVKHFRQISPSSADPSQKAVRMLIDREMASILDHKPLQYLESPPMPFSALCRRISAQPVFPPQTVHMPPPGVSLPGRTRVVVPW
jgi:hypothetical protein